MPAHHAVVWIDHHHANILELGSPQVREHKVNEQLHLHGAQEKNERVRHVFMGQVCDALQGIAQVLVVGGHTSLADFRHYVAKHRPDCTPQLRGYQVVDHPSDKELLALARGWFAHQESMLGIDA